MSSNHLKSGFLAEKGLLSAQDLEAAEALQKRLEADSIETVRLVFADQHGVLRGKTLVAGALGSVLRSGLAVPSTLLLKDTSHRTVFPVWSSEADLGSEPLKGAGDVLLVPDVATCRVLPWAPGTAWILCDVVFKSGEPVSFASRTVLKSALAKLNARNLDLVCGLEVEFHVYRIEDERLDHADAGMPGAAPETSLLAQGYQLLTETRYDALQEIMDELRVNAQALGLPVRSMEAEFGPSQCEFTFEPDGALAHADAMMLFRSMVKQVCRRRGLHATFMCRPKVENSAASGWHLHQSLVDLESRENLFVPANRGEIPALAGNWIAGLLDHAAESCLLTTPTVNGYKRYQPYQLAPDRIQWGIDNKGAMVRGLLQAGDRASRVENRVAEPAANPYFYIASQVLGGLSGIARNLAPPAPVEAPYDSTAAALPKSMIAAIEAFEQGTLFREEIGAEFVAYLSRIKRAEWERYLMTVSEWEQREYFSLF